MRIKTLSFLTALVLCISAFVLPMTAFAATSDDTTPPTITAKLDGQTLNVETSDDISGVEAVYVDGNRINSLANGKASVALKDYAGTARQVSVYAVDYSGNRSETIKIDNPYYSAPSTLPSATPSPNTSVTQTPTTQQPSSAPSDDNGSDNEETESAIPDGAFTPDGTGTVLDEATENEDAKQFYTITTAAGNVFYLIIDGKRDANNVYFLNAVTEADLMALAEDGDGSVSVVPEVQTCACLEKCEAGAVNSACPVCKNDLTGCTAKAAEPSASPEPQTEPEKESNNAGMIIFVVLVLVVAGGAGYYFKIVRPKQQAALDDEDEFEDDDSEDYDSGMDYNDEYLSDEDDTPEDGE